MKTWKILLIILLEGFVTISVEILAIRQLIPMVGNSVVVTSIIIGVFLLVLAYGYQSGGRYRQAPIPRMQRNFLFASIGIGIGLSILFISYFFQIVNETWHIALLWTLVIYLVVVIAPIVYFLGQTVPLVMNLFSEQPSAAALGGKVLHLSTIGSFLGSVLTALLLMNFLGVAWTVVINFLLLAVLVLLCSNQKNFINYLTTFIIAGLLIFIINRGPEMVYFVSTTPYANYAIVHEVKNKQGKVGTMMLVNNSNSSFLSKDKTAHVYIERIKTILFQQLQLSNKDILVLGAGGFTLSAANTFNNRFTYVDIDPRIYTITRQNFLATIRGKFIADDARLYAKNHPNSYDVIISDTYSNRLTIPSHLLTQEYFAAVKTALRSNGIAIFNIIAQPLLNTAYAKRVDNTLRSVFSSCTTDIATYSLQKATNILYICQNNAQAADRMIYTDDLNRASLDHSL